MAQSPLAITAETYLHKLCTDIDNRCVGSKGNRQATDFFAEKVSAFGFETPNHPYLTASIGNMGKSN